MLLDCCWTTEKNLFYCWHFSLIYTALLYNFIIWSRKLFISQLCVCVYVCFHLACFEWTEKMWKIRKEEKFSLLWNISFVAYINFPIHSFFLLPLLSDSQVYENETEWKFDILLSFFSHSSVKEDFLMQIGVSFAGVHFNVSRTLMWKKV